MIAHPMISAMMALPVVVVALPVLLIGGWLLKNALGHAAGEGIVKHFARGKDEDEKAVKEAQRAFLAPFVQRGVITGIEMLRLLKDEFAYAEFHARYQEPLGEPQHYQPQPPLYYPPRSQQPSHGDPHNTPRPRRRRR